MFDWVLNTTLLKHKHTHTQQHNLLWIETNKHTHQQHDLLCIEINEYDIVSIILFYQNCADINRVFFSWNVHVKNLFRYNYILTITKVCYIFW